MGWACAFVLSELDDIVAERTRGFSCLSEVGTLN